MNKRSTPSGDGRGRGRDGKPRSGGQRPDRSSFRADRDGSRGGYAKPDSRGGSGSTDSRGRDGGYRAPSDRPARPDSREGRPQGGGFAGRDSGGSGRPDSREGRPQSGGYSRPDSREGRPQGGGYGRPDSREGRPQSGGYSRPDSREGRPQSGGYSRPDSREGRPQSGGYSRPDSREGRPSQGGGFARRESGGYGRPDSREGRPQGGGYGRPDSREGRPQGGGYGRPDSREGRPQGGGYTRPASREGRPQGGGFAGRDSGGYGRPDSREGGYSRPASRPQGGGFARRDDDRTGRPDSREGRPQSGGYSRPENRDRPYSRSGDDRGGAPRADRGSSYGRTDDRGSSRADGSGSRARYGRPEGGASRGYAPRDNARGFERPRDDSRGFDRPDDSRSSSRGDDARDRPRGDAGRGFEQRPRRDGAPAGDGAGGTGRDHRPSGTRGSSPSGTRGSAPRADRGGSRRDEVQTLGGGTRGRFGRDSSRSEFRTGRNQAQSRKPVANQNPFKTAKQPMRDPDFFDRGYVDERDTTEVPGGERLQKVLAQAGVASRRACEELIGEGRVTVDNQVVRRFGARVDPAKQIIHVDGKRIPTAPDLVYYALNKPIGVVSTMEDPEGRPCLRDYVQELAPRLFHVGRLDTETEGLLLLTNDGELAHRLTHPSFGVQKKYWAKVPGPVHRDLHRVLRKGIELEDGLAKVDEFHVVQEHAQQALVEVVLHEGRKHIVRRLLEESGHRVIDLARIEFGPVKLGRLKPGTVRALSLQEVGELYAAVKL
ncbi:hypothetical protein Acor_16820 [Acrocarpospora corrugata]|uniref:Pseudouridine synthase n=1 Tax=Acrocarpospora corrugata TaxID=35763 RepID=A0A5M3VTS0_9ACTN|nr:pseudouridine synthase [Acrocarpospora corrugata]GER99618.1 hypothetical protein Acor_16820 [Acrocarpospora corrugata]